MQDLSSKNLPTIKYIQFGKLCVDLSDNHLTEIDNFIDCKSVNFSYNKITEIKNISESTEELYIQNNKIETIKWLPRKLKELSVSYNPLKSITFDLRDLKYLEFIDLSNTELYELPSLPRSIQEVDICNTKITTLPTSIINTNICIFRHTMNVDNLHASVRNWLDDIGKFECIYMARPNIK